MILGTVESCLRYPVKSFQGLEVSTITVQTSGVVGDRERAVIDLESQRVLSAKRAADMLMASASDSGFSIPGQGEMSFDDPSVDSVLSAWLGREVALRAIGQLESSAGDEPLAYEMTFEVLCWR
ncbi:MAG: MOSC N-terminal beta barrel domain-containing protein [Actinobacteria bacterium]|nr:MOSC N-terminal beta barrel domain-containing protein [Actinomycetota bacterium]